MDKIILEKNMRGMQTGSEKSFEQVYLLTQKKVFYVIYAIIKDYHLAEELMQDAYIKIREKIGNYNPGTNAQAWIITVARNIALNAYNKRKRELITDEAENEYIFNEDLQDKMNNKLFLKKLLTQLDETERQVVTLHALVGMKHREIAVELDKPIGTVLWIYNKALKKLKRIGEVKVHEEEKNH